MDMTTAFRALLERRDLRHDEMAAVMRLLMSGEATPAQIGGLLIGLAVKGETVEEVAAAVVLRDGMSASEREIMDFANGKLAAFKVPKKIVILDEIPKGATGKLQRIGLAQKLGLA